MGKEEFLLHSGETGNEITNLHFCRVIGSIEKNEKFVETKIVKIIRNHRVIDDVILMAQEEIFSISRARFQKIVANETNNEFTITVTCFSHRLSVRTAIVKFRRSHSCEIVKNLYFTDDVDFLLLISNKRQNIGNGRQIIMSNFASLIDAYNLN